MKREVRVRNIYLNIACAVLIAAVAVCFLLPSSAYAAQKGHYTALGLKAYKQKNYKLARTYFAKEPKYKEPCVTKMPSARKKAYSSVISKYKKSGKYLFVSAYYTDINNDGNAEMILKYGRSEADFRADFYEYYGGKTHRAGRDGAGHTVFIGYPGHNGVIADLYYNKGERLLVYKLKNHKIYTVKVGAQNVQDYSEAMKFSNVLAAR